jgi:hypothetical protein
MRDRDDEESRANLYNHRIVSTSQLPPRFGPRMVIHVK